MINIELNSCTKTYIKNKTEITAVNNVNFKFESGKLYVITGKNGSGKTTLLQCMGTIDTFSSGILKINNENVSHLSNNQLADIRKRNVGFIYQQIYLNSNLTALENVIVPLYLTKMTKESRLKKGEKLLEQVDMLSRKNHFPKELSGGEQQRISIARALANNPSIILADEPTASLDSENEEKVYQIFKKIVQNGKCVIIVSHNSKALNYADVVLKMKNGNLEIIKNA